MMSRTLITAIASLAFLVVACGGEAKTGEASTTSTASADTTSTTQATTTTSVATTTTLAPTTTSTLATTTTSEVDPEVLLIVWKGVFESNYLPLFQDAGADAIENDFYWIDSVDRVSYDFDENDLVVDATIDFEGVYTRDPQEWRDDTWTLIRSFSRDLWGAVVDGFEPEATFEIDWPTWTPALVLHGNVGRLTVECPGSLIVAVMDRQATQTEFESECAFTP